MILRAFIRSCFAALLFVSLMGGRLLGQAVDRDASSSTVISKVQAELTRQKDEMEPVYLEYTELRETELGASRGLQRELFFADYFEGNHFYERILRDASGKTTPHIHENAFDGVSFYYNDQDGKSAKPPAWVRKYLVSDATDPERWRTLVSFSYLDAVGVYAPRRIFEMQDFRGIEPVMLQFLSQSDSPRIQQAGEKIRVTVRVPDRYLVSVQMMDLDAYRKDLERQHKPLDYQNKWVSMYEKLFKMTPRRIVTLLLDPKFGYGITEREEQTDAGQKILKVESKGWKHYDSTDVWLPNQCVVSYYTNPDSLDEFSDQPMQTVTLTLTSVEFGHRDVQFALDQCAAYKQAGTSVTYRSIVEARIREDHQVGFEVAGDGSLLRTSALDVVRELRHGRRMIWRCIFLAVLGLPIMGGIVYLIRHKWNH